MSKPLGLKDIPIEAFDDELLDLKEYAESLSDFVLQCETPLTIALQGDWGSGKTSLMNLIQSRLKKSNPGLQTIWFNTWQFSQFDMQSDLPISLLSHFVDKLNIDENTTAKKLLTGLSKFGRNTLPQVASLFAGESAKHLTDKVFEMLGSDYIDNPVKQISLLKEEIVKLVNKKRSKDGTDRIVVFIDDLDRLLPEKAVELLEVFKLFLDVNGCVYVLACDYQVVTQGLKKKFGIGSDDLKGKSFFDKIIQLPFSMPIGQYNANNYIKNLLKITRTDYSDDDITAYANMAAHSIGFNPRGLKRLFNSLLLLNLVAEKKKLFEDQNKIATKKEKQRILFGTLCLQMAFEPAYRFLQKNKNSIDQNFMDLLADIEKLNNDTRAEEIKRDISDQDGSSLRRLSQFMGCFYESIQLASDNDKESLSENETETLKQILSFSSLTSVESTSPDIGNVERYKNRDWAKAFIEELNTRYADNLSRLKIDRKKFLLYQKRDANDPSIDIYFLCEGDGLRIEHNFWFSAQEMEYTAIGKNQKSIDSAKEWFGKNCTDVFPDKHFSFPQNNIHTIWHMGFTRDDSSENLFTLYKEKVIESLDILFPRLAETQEFTDFSKC